MAHGIDEFPQNPNRWRFARHVTRQIASAGDVTFVAACFVAALLFSGVLWMWSDRSLYGDGSNLLLAIIRTRNFFHVSQTRTSSTFMTQLPVMVAIKLGVQSMPVLIRLYTLGLAFVPILCHATSIWISRRDPLLFAGTAFVILVCFYPISFLLVGEGNVYLALFWLSFILLMTGKVDTPVWALLLLVLSIAAIKAYETSLLFSFVLTILCVFRFATARTNLSRVCLALAMPLFLAGAWFGLDGVLFPRDAANEAGFSQAILKFWQNGTIEGLLILTSLGIAAALAPDKWLRAGIVSLVAGGFAMFAYTRLQDPTFLSLGYVIEQRAQVYVILGGVVAVLILSKLSPALARQPNRVHALVLLVPLAAIVGLDTYDSIGMHNYLNGFCTILERHGVAPEQRFFNEPETHKFGWNWTFPIVSALIRPAGNRKVFLDPTYHGWMPLDPRQPLPEVDTFKRRGSFCSA